MLPFPLWDLFSSLRIVNWTRATVNNHIIPICLKRIDVNSETICSITFLLTWYVWIFGFIPLLGCFLCSVYVPQMLMLLLPNRLFEIPNAEIVMAQNRAPCFDLFNSKNQYSYHDKCSSIPKLEQKIKTKFHQSGMPFRDRQIWKHFHFNYGEKRKGSKIVNKEKLAANPNQMQSMNNRRKVFASAFGIGTSKPNHLEWTRLENRERERQKNQFSR